MHLCLMFDLKLNSGTDVNINTCKCIYPYVHMYIYICIYIFACYMYADVYNYTCMNLEYANKLTDSHTYKYEYKRTHIYKLEHTVIISMHIYI